MRPILLALFLAACGAPAAERVEEHVVAVPADAGGDAPERGRSSPEAALEAAPDVATAPPEASPDAAGDEPDAAPPSADVAPGPPIDAGPPPSPLTACLASCCGCCTEDGTCNVDGMGEPVSTDAGPEYGIETVTPCGTIGSVCTPCVSFSGIGTPTVCQFTYAAGPGQIPQGCSLVNPQGEHLYGGICEPVGQ